MIQDVSWRTASPKGKPLTELSGTRRIKPPQASFTRFLPGETQCSWKTVSPTVLFHSAEGLGPTWDCKHFQVSGTRGEWKAFLQSAVCPSRVYDTFHWGPTIGVCSNCWSNLAIQDVPSQSRVCGTDLTCGRRIGLQTVLPQWAKMLVARWLLHRTFSQCRVNVTCPFFARRGFPANLT